MDEKKLFLTPLEEEDLRLGMKRKYGQIAEASGCDTVVKSQTMEKEEPASGPSCRTQSGANSKFLAKCSCGAGFINGNELRKHLMENTTHSDGSVSAGGFEKWKSIPRRYRYVYRRPRQRRPVVKSERGEDAGDSGRLVSTVDIGPLTVVKQERFDDDGRSGWDGF